MKDRIKHLLKSYSNIHLPGSKPDVFIFSTPRSGSTWLMELIWTQPRFKYCNEPLNIRNWRVRTAIGIDSWEELYSSDPGRLDKLDSYFRRLQVGQLRFLNPNPFRRYCRPFTSRIVFKIINGGEADINWFHERLGGSIVYLIRHPIPVTLSRKVLPRLHAFTDTDYATHFTTAQLACARHIIAKGNHFEKGIMSWCVQNAVPLADIRDNWTVLTYEQLVVNPESVVQSLAHSLSLTVPDRMKARIGTASTVTVQSDSATLQHFSNADRENRQWLVEKWRPRVSGEQISFVNEILSLFEIEVYRADETMPCESGLEALQSK